MALKMHLHHKTSWRSSSRTVWGYFWTAEFQPAHHATPSFFSSSSQPPTVSSLQSLIKTSASRQQEFLKSSPSWYKGWLRLPVSVTAKPLLKLRPLLPGNTLISLLILRNNYSQAFLDLRKMSPSLFSIGNAAV